MMMVKQNRKKHDEDIILLDKKIISGENSNYKEEISLSSSLNTPNVYLKKYTSE